MLLLREKLCEQHRTQDLSKLDKDALNKYRRQGHVTGVLSDKERHRSSTDVEKSTDDLHGDLENVIDTSADPSTALIVKCLKLMLNNRTAKRARLLSAVSITYERSVFSRTSVSLRLDYSNYNMYGMSASNMHKPPSAPNSRVVLPCLRHL